VCFSVFSQDYFVLVLFAFVLLDLVSSILCQEIGQEERLQNDMFCRVGRKTLTQWINEFSPYVIPFPLFVILYNSIILDLPAAFFPYILPSVAILRGETSSLCVASPINVFFLLC